ncbi:MAG TPA: M20/M25/M40 family metallo-hydrolase, partial [Capillimicrobium sp.]
MLPDSLFQRTLVDLHRLVAIPSVSADGPDAPALRASAEAVRAALSDAGAQARVLDDGPWAPAVLGRVAGPPGAPRVLLYAHHDVQPAGDVGSWTSPPFAAVERDGRLYGRGAADNGSGLAVHLAALRALAARPPVELIVLVEGEEEVGSPHIEELLAAHGDELRADVVVIVDGASAAVGQPSITISTRGMMECDVTVRTLARPGHSGLFGGAVPDALTALVRLLATLHGPDGRLAVDGLERGPEPVPALRPEAVRADAALLDGVELIGGRSLEAALWQAPSATPIAIDAPRFDEARNALEPVARARLNVRLAPHDDPARAASAIRAHLERHVEWGAHIEVETRNATGGWAAPGGGRAIAAARAACAAAWGSAPVELGLGGSLPLLRLLAGHMPDAEIVLLGIQDPGSSVHGVDESVSVADLEKACAAEIDLL